MFWSRRPDLKNTWPADDNQFLLGGHPIGRNPNNSAILLENDGEAAFAMARERFPNASGERDLDQFSFIEENAIGSLANSVFI
jgi:hypothetical protein